MFLTATQGEVLLSDTTRLAQHAQDCGVSTTLHLVEDSVHVFTLFPFLPEAQQILAELGTWCRTQLAAAARGGR
ncbi:hypothetical protein D3C78_1445540 [compost metagenome]